MCVLMPLQGEHSFIRGLPAWISSSKDSMPKELFFHASYKRFEIRGVITIESRNQHYLTSKATLLRYQAGCWIVQRDCWMPLPNRLMRGFSQLWRIGVPQRSTQMHLHKPL